MSDAVTLPEDTSVFKSVAQADQERGEMMLELIKRVQDELELSDYELASFLGVSEKTLKRRKEGGHFDRGEALQLEILGRVLEVAFETFADEKSAKAWLRSPVVSLGGRVPLSLLATLQGYERVTNILYRQAHGMY